MTLLTAQQEKKVTRDARWCEIAKRLRVVAMYFDMAGGNDPFGDGEVFDVERAVDAFDEVSREISTMKGE